MEPRISLITLGVTDLERATRFYADCLELPQLETPPSVSFFELGTTWLALWSRESLAADAGLAAQGPVSVASRSRTMCARRPKSMRCSLTWHSRR